MLANAKFLSYYCKCMHFGILRMIATSGFLTALECAKFVFGLGSARTPLGELTAFPRPPTWFKRDPTSKRKGKGGRERREGERTAALLTQIPGSAPGK